LEQLDLRGTGLDDIKVEKIVDGLGSAYSLTLFSLSHNNLAPKDPLIWPLADR
jgi:hypothetical protein